ncbi:hypothetical protein J6590_029973 [Homalodisca vitripennis]|nr:hypothetical protein J6590_029973 [Homalodisca vitripennis]
MLDKVVNKSENSPVLILLPTGVTKYVKVLNFWIKFKHNEVEQKRRDFIRTFVPNSFIIPIEKRVTGGEDADVSFLHYSFGTCPSTSGAHYRIVLLSRELLKIDGKAHVMEVR